MYSHIIFNDSVCLNPCSFYAYRSMHYHILFIDSLCLYPFTIFGHFPYLEATLDILVKNYDDDGDLHGTLRIALFGEVVPMTVLNFYSICNGVKRPAVSNAARIILYM